VVGRNGEVLVGLRHHAAGVNTFENSWKKAYTSRTFRIASGKFAENVGQNPVAGQLFLANITAARGALPIMIGQETIGAVGVSAPQAATRMRPAPRPASTRSRTSSVNPPSPQTNSVSSQWLAQGDPS
jgi:uncharacterized protein GlcG (DUF336 family)